MTAEDLKSTRRRRIKVRLPSSVKEESFEHEISDINLQLQKMRVCSRREVEEKNSNMKKRKFEDTDITQKQPIKIRKLGNDELAKIALVECRITGKLIEAIDDLLDSCKHVINQNNVIVQRQTKTVEELIQDMEEMIEEIEQSFLT